MKKILGILLLLVLLISCRNTQNVDNVNFGDSKAVLTAYLENIKQLEYNNASNFVNEEDREFIQNQGKGYEQTPNLKNNLKILFSKITYKINEVSINDTEAVYDVTTESEGQTDTVQYKLVKTGDKFYISNLKELTKNKLNEINSK